ncbi:uncharacterized protein K452DRAFT_276532 [Aplosporella prunicola CBS 121167]|uniref:Thioredoxin domain-containing protein n=1 Tax=Aplosporella prunicola CBS 121167 TaxID=1176127 RepID=A0A6A6B7L7_9PEZI|nr:uncharacterized protein K452DRAFT_276532 [Aplosporella prunicola CBS 121167]KAF2138771.1 hypothetical protein K452DRAFT_276532 [Aplosporella prunicola CBS 121167]
MDVQLYVYDLSQGLARQLSQAFLGIQIDAVYHTSVVFGGIEYFFGAGVQTCYPGTTHHGRPMEVVPLGKTSLDMDVISEYLDSLKQIYTAESYDLFAHNCNNFSNDFAMFLVGKGIPEHITSLPQTVLNTPFGQMLKPQIDQAMRTVTQAPVPPQNVPQAQRSQAAPVATNGVSNGSVISAQAGKVHNVTALKQLDSLMTAAKDSCAVIFFTSSRCAPCKICYPAYDELAAEAGPKAVLIKVDTDSSYEVASKYNIRSTPTFITFLKGKQEETWSGADVPKLLGNVRVLVQMAHPAHPHANLDLPKLRGANLRPVTYTKVPPLDKLITKMGDAGKDPSIAMVAAFITTRQDDGAREAPLPSLPHFSTFLRNATTSMPPDALFAAYDLLRVAIADSRVSGYFAEEQEHTTITQLIDHVNKLSDCPYNLRIVALHMACNLFTTPLIRTHLLASHSFCSLLTQLLSTSLLDDQHANVRVSAASLAFNISAANHRSRCEDGHDILPEGDQVELMAAILEALSAEENSKEAILGLVMALGLLVYEAPVDGELLDLCKAMDASSTVLAKEKLCKGESIVKEVGHVLLKKGVDA